LQVVEAELGIIVLSWLIFAGGVMADPTAVSVGLLQSQTRAKLSDEEETTLCPPDRATGASQSVSEVQTPIETPMGKGRDDRPLSPNLPIGFAMLKVSMVVSQKFQDRGVSFLPQSKPCVSKEDVPDAQPQLLSQGGRSNKVSAAPWLTRSFRKRRPIPPAPGSQAKQEATHRIILDHLKDEQEATSSSIPVQNKDEQEAANQASAGQHEEKQKGTISTGLEQLSEKQEATGRKSHEQDLPEPLKEQHIEHRSQQQHEEKQHSTISTGLEQLSEQQEATGRTSREPVKGKKETTIQDMPEPLKEQHMKYRKTNDMLKDISDHNQLETWLHDSNNSKGDETVDLLQRSMQKANSSVEGFLYRHELMGLFQRLDGNTWNAELTEELLANSGLEFSKDGKIDVATFLNWLVQTSASERVPLVG